MVKYHLASLALKALSLNGWTRTFYRDVLGNRFGARRRSRAGLDPYYLGKARRFLERAREHRAIDDGMHLLELGTGWMHFYALFIRLLYDVRVTLVDVWDNRQLDAFQRVSRDLDAAFDDAIQPTPSEAKRVHALLAAIQKVRSFDELYRLLDFDYRVDESGVHAGLAAESFDLAFSFDVLEHVPKDVVPALVGNTTRLLKRGGVHVHLIGIADHLTNYDRSMSPKNYLRYSDRIWKLLYENDVQYINRIQRREWLEIFATAGNTLLFEEPITCDIRGLKVHPQYRRFEPLDLACFALTVVARKDTGVPGYDAATATRGGGS